MRIPSSPDAPANPKVEGTDARASLFTEFDAMPDNFADEIIATDYLNISLQLHLDGIDAGGVVGGTLANILKLLGIDTTAPGLGDLLDNLGLGGLLGLSKPATSGRSTKSGSSGGSAGPSSGGTSDPLGLSSLLNGLLGGGN